ncbi:MAG: alpha/beta hydrolase [Chloroflexota bacterium]
MKKIIWIVLLVTLVGILVAAGALWYMSMQPLYQPGFVRQGKNLRAALTPLAQGNDPDYWQMEPDMRLYHFAHGQGRNVLIVHGGPGMPFRQALSGLEPLAEEYRFHYYDQRGCGKSTRPFDRFESSNMYANMTSLDRTLGLGAQIADIERIRQILGNEKLILVGHSWGGFLASLYAAEFPERIQALVLISPATALVMPQEEADLFDTVHQRLPEAQRSEFDAFMQDYMDFNKLFTRSEADLIALNERFGEYYASVVDFSGAFPEQGEPGGWMSWGMYVSMGQRHDYRVALQPVTAPVLVLHGADDLQSEAASRQYADLFPNARFVVIENAGHFSFEEQPEQFADAVAAFLKDK